MSKPDAVGTILGGDWEPLIDYLASLGEHSFGTILDRGMSPWSWEAYGNLVRLGFFAFDSLTSELSHLGIDGDGRVNTGWTERN